MSDTRCKSTARGEQVSVEEKVDRLKLVLKFKEAEHAIERCLWDLHLAEYDEHKNFSQQLVKTAEAPHQVLFSKALYYLQRLDIRKREHASGIRALGQVVSFAGELAAMYRPDPEGKGGEDDTTKRVQ